MRGAQNRRSQDSVKEATIGALKQVIDPLVGLMFDGGITVQEFCHLLRERAVRSAATRIAKESGRISKSRVAIITGLPRSEIARILSLDDKKSRKGGGQHPIRKVLAGWHDNQRFLSSAGEPAVLPMFGLRRSFEQLIAIYGSGIPVRAMLDQLTQINAVEVLPGQRVRAKSRVPIFTGLTTNAIAAIGDRTGDLLATLSSNVTTTASPLFEGTAVVTDIDIGAVPLLRRELAEQGAAFIDGANSLLARSRSKPRRTVTRPSKCRIGVTVYYFQNNTTEGPDIQSIKGVRRKNFQRQAGESRIARLKKSCSYALAGKHT
jgi:Family of unknown function (DUF6502)